MPPVNEVLEWRGQTMVDSDGDKIGTIEEIYLDTETDAARVGAREHRPVRHQERRSCRCATRARGRRHAARAVREGDTSRTPRRSIPTASSPSDEESALYRHYGLEYSEARSDSGLPEGGRRRPAERPRGASATTSRPRDRRRDDALRGGAARRHDRARDRPRAAAQVRRRPRTSPRPCRCGARRSASSASRSPTPTVDAATVRRRTSPRRSTRSCCTRRRSWSRSAPSPRSACGSTRTP